MGRLKPVSVWQLAAHVLALGRRLHGFDASHRPVPRRGTDIAPQKALRHVRCEVRLVLVKLGRMGRVQVALLVRAAKLHAVCVAVVAAVNHCGLLVLAHGL